jgi:autotransporter-associated beta strand protein
MDVSGGSLSCQTFSVAPDSGSTASTVNQTGGNIVARGEFRIANNPSAVGVFNMTNGSFSSFSWSAIGSYGQGTLNLAGGTLSLATNVNSAALGDAGGSVGVANVSGGILNAPNGLTVAKNWDNGAAATGTLNLSGTGLVDLSAANLFFGANANAAGILNLNGGTLRVGSISQGGGSGTFNFNGGTLKAGASSTTFGGLTAAYVLTGGAIIDSSTNSITIAQPLLNDGVHQDGGLTKNGNGKLFLNGINTYTNVTTVAAGTLGGTGMITGKVVIGSSAGFNLSDGAAGTLTLAGGLTLGTGNSLTFDVGTSADQIAITGGTYTVPGTAASVNIVALPTLSAGTYSLITGANGISLSSFTLATTPPPGFGYALQVSGNGLQLVVSSVAPAGAFWKGGVNGNWNSPDSGPNFNWATDVTGNSSTVTGPALPTAVTFSATGATHQNTTLGTNFTIKSLTFNTSAGSVTIGVSGSESLTVNSGVTNNSANVQTFNAPVTFNGNQTLNASGAGLVLNSSVTNVNNLTVDGANNTIAGAISGAGSLTKVGSGILTVSNYTSGLIEVDAGTVNANGAVTPGDIRVGQGATGVGTVNIGANSSVSMPGSWLTVGRQGGTGTLNVNGSIDTAKLWVGGQWFDDNGTGTVNINTSSNITANSTAFAAASIVLGQASGGSASGTINLTNGNVFANGELWVGAAGGASGTVNQYGGTVTSTRYFLIGVNGVGTTGTYNLYGGVVNASTNYGVTSVGDQIGSTGVLNVSGGTFNSTVGDGGGVGLSVGTFWDTADGTAPVTGTLNISGTGFVNTGTLALSLGRFYAFANGTVNLNGGTLQVGSVAQGFGVGVFNFNGGTLEAGTNSATFMQGLTAANVLAGGAHIDSGTNNITIAQSLVNDGVDQDGGLTKTGNGTLFLDGVNSYTNVTAVAAGMLGGSGSIAGAVTVAGGAGLAPGDSAIGTLTINGNLTLNNLSTNVFEVDGTAPANDQVMAGGTVSYGGVLKIVPSGTFTVGQTFTLFSGAGAVNTGRFGSIAGSPGSGLGFAFTNGVLSVVTAPVGPSGPEHLTNSYSAGQLHLSWPTGEGWRLQMQTNSLTKGLGTNWVYITDGGVSSTNITVDSTKPTVFYRLVYP